MQFMYSKVVNYYSFAEKCSGNIQWRGEREKEQTIASCLSKTI